MSPNHSKNRDITRQNKASSVVSATIYSQICDYGLRTVLDFLDDDLFQKNQDETIKKKINDLIDTVSTCKKALQLSSNMYMRCSTYIKLGAVEIASNENSILKRAIKFKEYEDLEEEMDHFQSDMLVMHKSIAKVLKRRPIKTPTLGDNCEPDITTTPPMSTIQEIPIAYTQRHAITSPQYHSRNKWFKLPPPLNPGHYYTPLEAVHIVISMADNRARYVMDLPTINNNGRMAKKRISENLIIIIMIMKAYLPINRTSMYVLLNEFRNSGSLKFKYWRQRNKTGPKPMLKRSTLTQMVKKYEEDGDGGHASSRLNLETTINEKVKSDWLDYNNIRAKKVDLPVTSMNRIVNKVMALKAFNILNNVSNKTQSRYAAEYSVRSTIAYMMVVLTTHFVNAKPSIFHSKHKEISKNPLYKLLTKLNKKSLGVKLNEEQLESLTYVLPNLITSTDECSLFITNQKILNKISWYFSVRPNRHSSSSIDSSRRDNFTTDLHGDAHLRGLRISLNNTFTAGGQCAPIFACIFGLKPKEMPRDEIVVCRCKGLVAASNVNGSMDDGFVVFIRGKFETVSEREDLSHQDDTNTQTPTQNDIPSPLSKESRVAEIYRNKVYYPFIKRIRTDHYEMSNDNSTKIPDNLTAVSWMDGCRGQLKLTTTEKVLETEKALKIITNKHSAARTAVEQAADVGPMFKMMKATIKKMTPSNTETSAVYHRLSKMLENLQDLSDPNNGRVVILPLHKKQAIIVGLSKLPVAMSTACTSEIIQSAFRDNGQLDNDNEVVPNIAKMIGTYRGSIGEGHYLKDSERIIKKYYDETYMTGRIDESTYDDENVDNDRDRMGNIISRDFGISRENCQRAKILSCETQRQARIQLRDSILKKEQEKRITLYLNESKKYELNTECESRIRSTYLFITSQPNNISQLNSDNRPSFDSIASLLTDMHFGRHKIKGISKIKPNCDHIKAFIQVRHKITEYKGGAPIYKPLQQIKRDELISMCIEYKTKPILRRQFPVDPREQQLNNVIHTQNTLATNV